MSTRKIKDAVDRSTGEKVYYKGHAKATFMSDGRTVEDAIKTAGGGGGMAVIDHGTADTTFTLTSGVIHKWGIVSSLTLSVPEDTEGMLNQYRVIFTASSNFSITLPDTMVWSGGEVPEFSEWKKYELNIEGGRIAFDEFEDMDGYELDWVENDATDKDYIITDIIPQTGDTGVECSAISYSTNTCFVVGARSGDTTQTDAGCLFRTSGTVYTVDWNSTRHDLGSCTVGEVTNFSLTGTPLTATQNLPLYIFGVNKSGEVGFNEHIRVYYIRLLGADGTPRVNLVPYRKKGQFGMLDKVSGKFYPSVLGKLTGGYNE